MNAFISVCVSLLLSTVAAGAVAESTTTARVATASTTIALSTTTTTRVAPGTAALDKQWTTDLAAFANRNRGNWIVISSPTPGITPDEALDAARAAAARALAPRLQACMRRAADRDWLQQHLEVALVNYHGFVADQHLVKRTRPYGDTWTAYILVDAHPKHLEFLSRDLGRRLDRQRHRIAGFLAGSATIVVAVMLVFVLANWLTRGFLRLRLAAASAVVILIGIATLTLTQVL